MIMNKDYELESQEKIKYKNSNKEQRSKKKIFCIIDNNSSSEDVNTEYSNEDNSDNFMRVTLEDLDG